MPAFGYVRKSVMADDDRTHSPAVQAEAIRHLAAAHHHKDIILLEDLDVSGAKVEERRDYMRLKRAIEDGEATAVYAYDLSRLHRNTKEALAFFELAEAHNVPVTLVEGNIDTGGDTGKLVLTVLAALNTWTSGMTSTKIKASMAAKRARGERLGGRRYGEVRTITNADGTSRVVGEGEDRAAVVEAYRATGSFLRAAKRLHAAGVPTRNGKSKGWSPSAVRSIVHDDEPDLIIERRAEDRPVRGSRTTARRARFGRILRCSVCDSMLTPSYDPKRGAWRYYCHGAHRPGHGRKNVMESAIIRAMAPAVANARATGASAKARAAMPPKAKAEPKPRAESRTTCSYHEGGRPESNNFRALTSAPFICDKPRAKGKMMCEAHEHEYVAAAKHRASIRRAEDDGQAGIDKPKPSAAAAANDAKAKAAKKPATSEERVARTVRRSTPPAPPREPVARIARQASVD